MAKDKKDRYTVDCFSGKTRSEEDVTVKQKKEKPPRKKEKQYE